MCFVPPLESLWPGEARKLVTLGAGGGEGMDPRPQLPVGPFTSTQPLGMGGGLGERLALGEGKGVLVVGCGVG